MMGSALAFPARENGHTVRLVGTHLDRDIIEECKKTGKHPKFNKAFPAGIEYYHVEDAAKALACLPQLRGCQAHISVIPSSVDSIMFNKLGLQLTCEPEYEKSTLFVK